MRLVRNDPSQVEVVLARRNLLSLLLKLYIPGSARTLASNDQGALVVVRSESDEAHYGQRTHPPGPTVTQAQAAMQVAIDLIEQVSDSQPDTDAGRYNAQALDKMAARVAYLREHVADERVRIV